MLTTFTGKKLNHIQLILVGFYVVCYIQILFWPCITCWGIYLNCQIFRTKFHAQRKFAANTFTPIQTEPLSLGAQDSKILSLNHQ